MGRLGEFVACVKHLSQYWWEFVPKRGTSMATERIANFSDEVKKYTFMFSEHPAEVSV